MIEKHWKLLPYLRLQKVISFMTLMFFVASCGDITTVEFKIGANAQKSNYDFSNSGDIYSVNPVVATGNRNVSRAVYGDRLIEVSSLLIALFLKLR